MTCPTCGRRIEWSPASAWRPFCSERCKLMDLGAWLAGERVIAEGSGPGEPGEPGYVRPDEDSGHRDS